MLLASLRGLLPSRSLLRVGRVVLGATTLHTAVVGGQQTADRLGRTALDGGTGPLDATGDELRHRRALRAGRRLWWSSTGASAGRHGGLPAVVGGGLPGVAGCRGAVAGGRRAVADRPGGLPVPVDRCRAARSRRRGVGASVRRLSSLVRYVLGRVGSAVSTADCGEVGRRGWSPAAWRRGGLGRASWLARCWNQADSSSRKIGSSIVSSANRAWLSPEARCRAAAWAAAICAAAVAWAAAAWAVAAWCAAAACSAARWARTAVRQAHRRRRGGRPELRCGGTPVSGPLVLGALLCRGALDVGLLPVGPAGVPRCAGDPGTRPAAGRTGTGPGPRDLGGHVERGGQALRDDRGGPGVRSAATGGHTGGAAAAGGALAGTTG